jgi:hypothetical protein
LFGEALLLLEAWALEPRQSGIAGIGRVRYGAKALVELRAPVAVNKLGVPAANAEAHAFGTRVFRGHSLSYAGITARDE